MTKFFKIGVLLLMLTLTACSSKFAYNNLDWWVYWYLDDYISLTDTQEEIFDKHLNAWLQWHKSSELPRYKQQLLTLKQQLNSNTLNTNAINQHLSEARSHWQRVRDKISPPLARLARTLEDDQVVILFAQIEKENEEEQEERDEYLAKSPKERQEERLERLIETVEEQIGDINDDQREIIATYSEQFTSTADYWLAYRKDIQQAARRLFVTRHVNENFVNDLVALIENPDAYRSEAYILARAQNQTVMATMASEIATTLTNKQKDYFIDNLDELIDTLDDFME